MDAKFHQTRIFDIRIWNKGRFTDSFTIQGRGGENEFSVRYFAGLKGNTEITSEVNDGSYVIQDLPPDHFANIRIAISVASESRKGSTHSFAPH